MRSYKDFALEISSTHENRYRVFRALLNSEARPAAPLNESTTISRSGERNNEKWARLCHYRHVKYFVGGSATACTAITDARGSLSFHFCRERFRKRHVIRRMRSRRISRVHITIGSYASVRSVMKYVVHLGETPGAHTHACYSESRSF